VLDATRRGSRAPHLVPREVRVALAAGAPSVNHMEQIAFDMGALLASAFPGLACHGPRLREGGLVGRMRAGGEILFSEFGEQAWTLASVSGSDTVRGWGAMAVGAAEDLSLADRLVLIRRYADDPHFAVREWAWLAVRPHIAREPADAIHLLGPWTADDSANVRRFASEATRPRGVWSVHIPALKRDPQLGLPVLEPLFQDPALYVQNSVGNWLNDASRSSPKWVRQICRQIAAGGSTAGARICRRGLRTLSAPA